MSARGKELLLLVLLANAATAAQRRVDFNWVGPPECPDEQQARQEIAARLGYEPFDAESDVLVRARITKETPALKGTIELSKRDGTPQGRRELSSATGDCAELSAAMELAIAIAIDPQSLRRTSTPVVVVPEKVVPALPTPSPPAPPPLGPRFVVGAGVLGAAGTAPAIAPGAVLRVGAEWERFSLALEGRADLSTTLRDARGSVSASVLLAAVVPCLRVWHIDGCAVISAGALQVSSAFGGLTLRQSTPLLLVGVRVQAVLELSELISVRPFVDAQAVLTRTSLLSGSEVVWVTPPIAGALGAALVVRIY